MQIRQRIFISRIFLTLISFIVTSEVSMTY